MLSINGREKPIMSRTGRSSPNVPKTKTGASKISRQKSPTRRIVMMPSKPKSHSSLIRDSSQITVKNGGKIGEETVTATGCNTESIHDQALRLLASTELEGLSKGKVKVRFNHYNKDFPIYNGVLKWTDIDEQYSFSFVYRGNYKRELYQPTISEHMDELSSGENLTKQKVLGDIEGEYFIGLTDGEVLFLKVTEDPVAGVGAEGMRLYDKPSQYSSNDGASSHTTQATGADLGLVKSGRIMGSVKKANRTVGELT
jgi:hypothetical protein